MTDFYFQIFQNADWVVISAPFIIALVLFVLNYRFVYIRHTSRVRTRQIVKALTSWLQRSAIALCFLSLVPVIVFGSFSNEFVRIAILATTFGYTYWAHLHWIVRILVSKIPIDSLGSNNASICSDNYGKLLLKRVFDSISLLLNRYASGKLLTFLQGSVMVVQVFSKLTF